MGCDDFDCRFASPELTVGLKRIAPNLHEAARRLWATAFADSSISGRMKELVLLSLFASPAGYNQAMVDQQIARAMREGASRDDVADVLISVAGLSNHALYMALPLAEAAFPAEEIAGSLDQEAVAAVQNAKEEFIRARGFWNPARDVIERTMPEYLLSSTEFSAASTRYGSLTQVEREMVYIAIDASVNHMSELGLKIHFANARKAGMTFPQVAAVLKIVGVVGLLAYVNSARHIAVPQPFGV